MQHDPNNFEPAEEQEKYVLFAYADDSFHKCSIIVIIKIYIAKVNANFTNDVFLHSFSCFFTCTSHFIPVSD